MVSHQKTNDHYCCARKQGLPTSTIARAWDSETGSKKLVVDVETFLVLVAHSFF